MTQQPDPWGFEEEAVETWGDILAPQALDLTILAAFLIFAFISFRRKSVPLKYATLVFAVAYMGFAKSHLISITNTTLNQTGQAIEAIALAMAVYLVVSVSLSLAMNAYNASILRRGGRSA